MKWKFSAVGLSVVFILSVLWGALFTYAEYERKKAYDNTLIAAGNLAIAFEENVHSILSGGEWALDHFAERYRQDLASGGDGVSALALESLPPIAFQLSFIDAGGRLRYSSLQSSGGRSFGGRSPDGKSSGREPVNLADREHFRVHVDAPSNRMFVSRPVFGRVSGVWSVQLSKRATKADGSFAGVLVLSVDRRRFSDFFDRVNVGRRGNITLIGLDHWVRARASLTPTTADPYETPVYDRPFFEPGAPTAGYYDAPAQYDREDRFGAYRKLRDYPLVVAALYSVGEVMEPLNEKTAALVRAAALASALIVASATFIGALLHKREQAKRSMKENEARWRRAVEAVGDGVWDWRPETDAVTYSPNWMRMLGFDPQETDATTETWRSLVHPDDLRSVDKALMRHLHGDAPLFVREYRMRRKDGDYIWVLDRGVVVERDEHGAPTRVLGIAGDISGRRRLEDDLARKNRTMQALQAALAEREIAQSQRRLSEAQRVARLGVMEKAGDPRAALWRLNPHARDLLGLGDDDAPDETALETILGNVAAADRPALAAAFTAFPAAALDVEFPVHTAGGTHFLHAVGATVGATDGVGSGERDAFVMVQDVTARRSAEKEREQIRARVEENSRMEALGTLAAGIAHEINTPSQFVGDNLAFLQSGSETLLDVARLARRAAQDGACPPELSARLADADLDFLEQEMPEAAAQALNGVERISAIVRAVKEFCHPGDKEPKPFDVNHMVRTAATVTRNSWKYVADLTLDLTPDMPEAIGIEGEMNQVLVNLIVNAAQAVEESRQNGSGSPQELGRIVVSTSFDAAEAILSVADDGVGIPPDKHGKIFELFYTTKPPGSGTGQGLAVSAAIVRRCGGRIVVASDVGKGARFDVRIPRVQADDDRRSS